MDTIFRKTNSIFSVVQRAREEPRRYGKNGELLINYDETEEHLRRASVISGGAAAAAIVENKNHSNPDDDAEKGNASSST
jgi:hypothetical protein